MIVDDEPAICGLLATVLKDEGHDALTVTSGADALARAPRERPDVFLIDVMMPGMDGRTLAARLCALPDLAPTPIIMMSAAVSGFARQPGVVAFVAKPFDFDRLLDCLTQAVDQRPTGP
jgi:CheY-like chemotaxis protein